MNHSAFRFRDEDTPIRRLDPRVKFAMIALLSLALIFTESWETAIIGGFTLSIAMLGRVRLLRSFQETKPILALFLLTFLFHTFFSSGETFPSVWRLTLSIEGLTLGAKVVLRLAIIVSWGFIYSTTTHPEETRSTFEWFLRPFPVDEKALGTSACMGIRFFPLMVEEAERAKEARDSRCLNFSDNILRRLRNTVVPLLVRSVKRAEALSRAMEARSYSARRTSSIDFAVTPLDLTILAAVASLLVSLFLL